MARPIRVSVLADPKDFVSGMKEAAQAAAQTETDLSSTEKAFDALDASMSGISEGADFISGEFGRIGAGLTGVGDRLTEMNPEWAGFGNALSEAGKNLTLVSDAMDIVTGVMNVGQAALGLFRNGQILSTIATQGAAAAQWLWNAALSANPIGIVILAIAALVAGLVWFFTQTEVGRQAWSAFTAFLTSAWEKFKSYMSAAWNAIVGFFRAAGTNVMNAWNAVAAFFSGLPGKIKGFFSGAISWLTTAGRNILDGLKNGATAAWNTVSSWISGIKGKITALFNGAIGWLTSAGGDLLRGLWNGISNTVGWVKSQIAGVVGNITNYFRDLFGVHSPSVVFEEIGGYLGLGLAEGIAGSAGDVQSAMDDLAGVVNGTDFATSLAADTLRRGGTVIVIGDIEVEASNSDEANLFAEFAKTIQRKTKAGV